MATYNWKYLMTLDDGGIVYIDSSRKKSKIIKKRFIYFYTGIFPNIDFDSRKRFPKK